MELEQLTGRREFVYSLTSLILALLTWALHYSDLGQLFAHITTEGEIPIRSFIGVVACEGVKLILTFSLCPTPTKVTLKSTPFSGSGGRRVPGSTRFGKILELGGVAWSAVLCCGICHVFIILFGAPLMGKFVLTAQFSTILTGWMFSPLCLVFYPRDILQEVVYFSTWNTKLGSISRSKLRLMSTVAGAFSGVALIPLDWDRPWQVWPVPCLFSSFLVMTLVNGGFTAYFAYAYLKSCHSPMSKTAPTGRPTSFNTTTNNKTKNY